MKKLSLFISAFALCSSVSYMAMAAESVNCAQLPSCESLGYKDQIKYCPSRYIRCPFDENIGACLHEAAVGSVQFFPFDMDEDATNRGWLLCDGSEYSIDRYPELYALIGGNFCKTVHGGSCASGKFRVPDYRGYFLRAKGTPRDTTHGLTSNTSFNAPQTNMLPDVTGSFGFNSPTSYHGGPTEASGAFAKTEDLLRYVYNNIEFSKANSGNSQDKDSGNTSTTFNQFNLVMKRPKIDFQLKQKNTVTRYAKKITFNGSPMYSPISTDQFLNGDQCYETTSELDTSSTPPAEKSRIETTCLTPYGKSDGVVPQNYAVNAYIYTGKIIRMSLEDLRAPTDALYNAAHEFGGVDNITPPVFNDDYNLK